MKNMAKKHKKVNHRLIKSKRTYTIKQISKRLNRHISTVRTWINQGLIVRDNSKKNPLLLGSDIIAFIKQRQQKSRYKLKIDEFHCPKCKCSRKALNNIKWLETTNKSLGKNAKQVNIKSRCEVCRIIIQRFSSDRQIEEFKTLGLTFTEHENRLIGYEQPYLNTHIKREDKKDEIQCKKRTDETQIYRESTQQEGPERINDNGH